MSTAEERLSASDLWRKSLNLEPGSTLDESIGDLFALEQQGFVNENRGMITEKIPELKKLSPEEKLILVKELWDELAAHPDAFPQREDHIQLLKERLEHFRRNPTNVVAWDEVKARILGSR